jgi:hypothetical protein
LLARDVTRYPDIAKKENTMSAMRLLPALILSLGLSQPVQSQTLIDGNSAQEILNLARGYGSANLGTDIAGDPQITGRIAGTPYLINFYGCTNGTNCTTLQFRASWINPGHVTIESLHAWNRDKRFGKAYLDSDGDPVLEWDVNLFGGVSPRNLDDTIDWWEVVLTNFITEAL